MSAREPYRTLAGRGKARFEVRGSEFLGHAVPARSVAEAERVVREVRERYPDATHHVPAYRVRADPLPAARRSPSSRISAAS